MLLLLSAAGLASPPPPPPPWPFSCSAGSTVQDIAKPLNMSTKLVVVTGADGRSGSAVVLAAALTGARVVLAGRNLSKLIATVNATAAAVPAAAGRLETEVFDLANLSDTRRGAARLLLRHERIDVLVNNAGGAFGGMTADGYAAMFSVMNIASALLTNLLLPALESAAVVSGGARIVNVASAAGFDPLPLKHDASSMMGWARGVPHQLSTDVGYGVSKFLVIHYTNELDKWLREPTPAGYRNVNALAVNPGYFRVPPFTLSDRLACGTVMRFRPCPQLPEQGAAPIAFAALVAGADSAPEGKRLLDFETTRIGPAYFQHGDNCAPRAPPKWEAAEAADWFKLVQEAVQR